MPYEWSPQTGPTRRLRLWPHRSLPKRGLVWFVALTALMLQVPIVAVLGTAVLWGLLPFMALTVWALIYFMGRSYRDGALREVLTMSRDSLELVHARPGKPELHWEAATYWVTLRLQPDTGPVENYLTLSGNDRTVEIGAFLSPEERAQLYQELQEALDLLRAAQWT